jgi:sugar lactone lactonase YvrE
MKLSFFLFVSIWLVAHSLHAADPLVASGAYIYVSDFSNSDQGKVARFDMQGNYVPFGPTLNRPNGLAFDSVGNLYVSELGTIVRLAPDGSRSTFSTDTYGYIYALAFDPAGNLFGTDVGSHLVTKFNPAHHPTTFASGFSQNGPYGVATDSHGNVFVADSSAGNVFKYDSTGHGSLFATGMSFPTGLAVDRSDNLFIADQTGNDIIRVDPLGHRSVFAAGMMNPSSLAFDGNGTLWAAVYNGSNGLIEKFDAFGNGTIVVSGLTDPSAIAIYPVPEPSLLALGVLAAAFCAWRRPS